VVPDQAQAGRGGGAGLAPADQKGAGHLLQRLDPLGDGRRGDVQVGRGKVERPATVDGGKGGKLGGSALVFNLCLRRLSDCGGSSLGQGKWRFIRKAIDSAVRTMELAHQSPVTGSGRFCRSRPLPISEARDNSCRTLAEMRTLECSRTHGRGSV
jgi:hypothetical protein